MLDFLKMELDVAEHATGALVLVRIAGHLKDLSDAGPTADPAFTDNQLPA